MQFSKRRKQNTDISLIHWSVSQVSQQREKPLFLWSLSPTEYLPLLLILGFEMQIRTRRKEKRRIKVVSVWKASLCNPTRPHRTHLSVAELQREPGVPFKRQSSLITVTSPYVSVLLRNVQREPAWHQNRSFSTSVCPAVQDWDVFPICVT